MSAPAAPLYVREGSRFVLYDERRQHTPPIPVPVPVEVEGPVADPANPYRTLLPVTRCPHGSFARPGGPGRGCAACGRPVRSRRAR